MELEAPAKLTENSPLMHPEREKIAKGFSADERIRFLAVLMRIARVDEVSTVERDRLLPVTQWIQAKREELTAALHRADDPTITLEKLVSGIGIGDRGILLFREACAVVWVDGTKSSEEGELLDELALILGIADQARQLLDSPLASSPEGERRFLALLAGSPISTAE